MFSFSLDTRIPQVELTVDEMNLRTLIHDNPGLNKYELFIEAHDNETMRWDREKFNEVYWSLVEKRVILIGKKEP